MLNANRKADHTSHCRILSSPDLRFFVEHFWIIKWDLIGLEPVIGEVLPHPVVHLVFEENFTRLTGVAQGKFTRVLEGKGGVFGIKFRPGAFYPFFKRPISELTNKVIVPWPIFGMDENAGLDLERSIMSQDDQEKAIDIAEQFLRERLPERDENVETVNAIVKLIIDDQTITRVDDLVERLNIGKRAMQRLFTQYVGVSPKWVIKRNRIHEALEHLAIGDFVDLTKLAVDLGYFDQAHFIKDFKSLVGKSPAEYAKNSR